MFRFTNVDRKPTRVTPIYGFHTHALLSLRQALDPLLSEIDELDEFIMIAKAGCHYPSEHGLTREESASIYLYTMDWGEQSLYRVLNAALRVEDRSVLVPWHGYLKLFDTALKKLPSRQLTLWRGFTVNIKINYKEDEEITWWSFSSCSSALNVIQKFLGPVPTLFVINAENGKDISAYSSFPNEKEVILGLGTRLRVVSGELNLPALNVVHLTEFLDENKDELLFIPTTITQNQSQAYSKPRSNTDASRYENLSSDERKYERDLYFDSNTRKHTDNWMERRNTGLDFSTSTNDNRYKISFSQMLSHDFSIV